LKLFWPRGGKILPANSLPGRKEPFPAPGRLPKFRPSRVPEGFRNPPGTGKGRKAVPGPRGAKGRPPRPGFPNSPRGKPGGLTGKSPPSGAPKPLGPIPKQPPGWKCSGTRPRNPKGSPGPWASQWETRVPKSKEKARLGKSGEFGFWVGKPFLPQVLPG